MIHDFGRPFSLRIGMFATLGLCLSITTGCGTKPDPVVTIPPSGEFPSREDAITEPNSVPDPIVASKAKSADGMQAVADYLQAGDMKSAAEVLNRLLIANPDDAEALFYLANIRAAQGQRQTAINLLSEIPPEMPEAGLAALGVSAQWCFELEQYDEAEKRYRTILQLAPEADMARRPLAYLLNRQGRRHEAVRLIRELCESGNVTLDELHALIVEADAIYDPPTEEPTENPTEKATGGSRPYWPIGPMGQARYEFTQGNYAESAALIESLLHRNDCPASVIAFYGLAVAEAQDAFRFNGWLTKVTPKVKTFPEYWAAIGIHWMGEGEVEKALRSLAEALMRNPTDVRSTRRVIQGFRSLGNDQQVDQWVARYERLSQSVATSVRTAEGDLTAYGDLVKTLRAMDRPLEAILWEVAQAAQSPDGQTRMSALNAERLEILQRNEAFPSRQSVWGDWDFEQYPLAEPKPSTTNQTSPLSIAANSTRPRRTSEQARVVMGATPKMQNHSDLVGLDHRYRVSRQAKDHAFAIYQQNGGGVAALDYDLDGQPDLYLAQGAADPPEFIANESDQLLRNTLTGNQRLVADVTTFAGARENAYTLGVTSGDWNQDGFPDLATANIGPTLLLLNQGDGTFRSVMLDPDASKSMLSTSLAMGDIDGDRLPDLYVLNYLDDERFVIMPPLDALGNATKSISQHGFQAASDEVWMSQPDGTAKRQTVTSPNTNRSYGLGVVLTDITGRPGNEVFVGNDGGANHLWSYEPTSIESDSGKWTESAVLRGCAFGSFGAPTASMGIAAGDFDESGTLDFHVTNFYDESSCLYLQDEVRMRDLNVKFGIDRSSMKVLGFGAQAIDVSNRGRLDLIVGNGHIENLESLGKPFRQPMQLLENQGDRFEPVAVTDPSLHWDQSHLSRALIRLDFNVDGKSDIVVTDLLDPTALLINETATSHHWVGLRLIGTESERDAIGAKVQFRLPDRSLHAWVTAGDGYLGKNENTILLGLGDSEVIEEIVVQWPSGTRQVIENLDVDQYAIVIENEDEIFVQSHPTLP